MKSLLILGVAMTAFLGVPAMAQAECGCPGDANGDRTVGFDDILQILSDWGCMDCDQTDVDGDGMVGFNDILLVLANYDCGVPGQVTTISGTVINSITSDPIAGANILVGVCPLVTDETGAYTGEFPVGQYTVSFGAVNFLSEEEEVILFPGFPTVLDADLDPVAPVVVNVVLGEAVPGETVQATAVVHVLDGSTIQEYAWVQTGGAEGVINNPNAASVSVDLASPQDYRNELMHVLLEPPIGPEDLPEGIEFPEGEFPGGLQNRFHVVGASPFALEEAGLVGLAVDVTTTSGTYAGVADLHTELPWKPTASIRNVSIGIPVLLYGKDQASYSWQLVPPAGSTSTLADPTTQNPEFTPDIPGLYSLSVFDLDAAANVDIFVFAGTWRGVIVGQDADGRPIPEDTCLICHFPESTIASDNFTPWIQTGHAEIFTQNLNSSPYWGTRCFQCHTVGYAPDVDAFGIDEAPDYVDFIGNLLGNPSPDNWTTMLAEYPESAKLANVQCENCHGPQNGEEGVFSAAHLQVLPRVSLSSDVCATCHGEPLRHARFQQWQISPHANYELAIDEGDSGNCSRCHTANGFLTWLPILLGDAPGDPTASIDVTWTTDEVHPQTCVTCHDPHSSGTESGEPNNATVRISGNTPPLIGGFTAYGVGRGAICMTCHNSRRGLRNDSTFDEFYGTAEAARAPHGSSQTDVLMGQNAFLVETGNRGNHSFLADTCANCHMVQTQPPPLLAYNEGGTNHTFVASREICAECHTGFDADTIQGSVQDIMDLLQAAIEDGLFDYMSSLIDLGNSIDLDGEYEITDLADVADLEFGETRGRQSIVVTLQDETVLGPYRMNDIEVLDNLGDPIGDLYDEADPNLIKAGWNWNLVHNDGSLGVHNPSYALDVLVAGLEAIDPGLAGIVEWPGWYTGTDLIPHKEVSKD